MPECALSFPYTVSIEVSFRDLDAMGHVNNAVYLSYMETARIKFLVDLLAVDKKHRNGWVFWGLGKLLTEYCLQKGYDFALISGTPRQQKLYKHLGFMPFGPLVGTAEAPFQPMYLSFESFQRRARMFRRALGRDSVSAELKELIEADDVQVHGADDR